ncbi:Lrp/AsnC family transcriptional regulator [bacterium]|nr:MAG: Lrp/AsnC family transcriptional regulator [bacterium]
MQGGQMKPGAYMLINVATGSELQVAEDLRKIDGISGVRVVTGLHDVICYVEAETIEALKEEIIEQLRKVPGIQRTITCIALNTY